MKDKKLFLVIAVVLIVAAITYINMKNARKIDDGNVEEIASMQENERVIVKEAKYPRARELVGIAGYINTENITISENIGKKVILIDFWTYSCINCQRTLPYLNSWWEKYKDDGLLIIGIHTPEFEFEKDYENVVKAVSKYKVKYPVAQDNDYKTWQAYRNRYWPRKYLIDIDGFIVYDHIGEGSYEEIESRIQEALKERAIILGLQEEINEGLTQEDNNGFSVLQTPEIYLGLLFSRKQLGNKEGWQADKIVEYKMPASIERDKFYLEGSWKNNPDNMELVSQEGRIKLRYYARDVNIVAGSSQETEIVVYLDGKEHRIVSINEFDLYNLVDLNEYGEHELEIKASNGLMAYTFTFG